MLSSSNSNSWIVVSNENVIFYSILFWCWSRVCQLDHKNYNMHMSIHRWKVCELVVKKSRRVYLFPQPRLNIVLLLPVPHKWSGFKVPLLYDSQSTIRICHNPVRHSKTRHIALRYHFIKDHVEDGNMEEVLTIVHYWYVMVQWLLFIFIDLIPLVVDIHSNSFKDDYS